MSYESQMVEVQEENLAREQARLDYAIEKNAPIALIEDYRKEVKRIERKLAKARKALAIA